MFSWELRAGWTLICAGPRHVLQTLQCQIHSYRVHMCPDLLTLTLRLLFQHCRCSCNTRDFAVGVIPNPGRGFVMCPLTIFNNRKKALLFWSRLGCKQALCRLLCWGFFQRLALSNHTKNEQDQSHSGSCHPQKENLFYTRRSQNESPMFSWYHIIFPPFLMYKRTTRELFLTCSLICISKNDGLFACLLWWCTVFIQRFLLQPSQA